MRDHSKSQVIRLSTAIHQYYHIHLSLSSESIVIYYVIIHNHYLAQKY